MGCAAARDSGLWVCCGIVLRDTVGTDGDKKLLRGVALVGANGWLHGIHVDDAPASEMFAAGSGEWPATQRPRPIGVYDTELGRIGMHANKPDQEALAHFAEMGAELVVVPHDEGAFSDSRVSVAVRVNVPHANRTSYALCGLDAQLSKLEEER